MIESIKTVCDVTANALKNQSYSDTIINDKEFFTISLENGLIPIVYEALDHKKLSKPLLDHLSKHYYKYITHDIQMLESIKTLKEILNKNEIKHIFLKGSLLKTVYPKSYYRGMGDIDILITENDLAKVHDVFKAENIKLIQESQQHDIFLMHEHVNIEIHPRLYKDFNPKYAPIIQHPWKYTILEDGYTYKFEHEFNIVYLLYHLAKHLNSSGVGLRSILDIGIYVNYFREEINIDKLKELLEKTSLTTFFNHLIHINQIYFQIDDLSNFINLNSLSSDAYDEIMSYFSISGIHGKGHAYDSFENRLASSSKKFSNFVLLFQLMFPSYISMKVKYPILIKLPILLPFFWVIRWIKIILKKTKYSFKKLSLLLFKPNNDSIKQIKRIHNKLGL